MDTLEYEIMSQMREEQKIIQSLASPVCRREVFDKLGAIDYDCLNQMVEDQFTDCSVMESLRCMFEGLENRSPEEVKQFIELQKQIGEPSAFGSVFLANFGKIKALYAPKISRKSDESEMIHEEFVGLAGTNAIRCMNPGYAYVVGSINNCSEPIVDENRKVVDWCSGSNPTKYVFYENIPDAIPFSKFVRTASGIEFLKYYLQLESFLQDGVETCDFTHYDLHTKNVLLRQLVSEAALSISDIEELVCDKIATMIDFGQSHIKYQGRSFGYPGMEDYYTFADRSYPAHDAFKFLMFCAQDCCSSKDGRILNQEVFDIIVQIAGLFTEEPVTSMVYNEMFGNPEQRTYYVLPYDERTSQITHLEVIDFIRYMFPEVNNFIYPIGQAPTPVLISNSQRDPVQLALSLESHPPHDLKEVLSLTRYNGLDKEQAKKYLEAMTPDHLRKIQQQQRELLKLNVLDATHLDQSLDRLTELNVRNKQLIENVQVLKELGQRTSTKVDIPPIRILKLEETYRQPLEQLMYTSDLQTSTKIEKLLNLL